MSDDAPFFPPPKEKTAYRDPDPPKVVDAPAPKKRSLVEKDPMPLTGIPDAEPRKRLDMDDPLDPHSDRRKWIWRHPRVVGLLIGPGSAWLLWNNFQLYFHGGRYYRGSAITSAVMAFGGLYLLLFGIRVDEWGLPTERSKVGFYSALGVGLVAGIVLEIKLRSLIVR